MKSLKTLEKKLDKMLSIKQELKSNDYSYLVGKKCQVTKKYTQWIQSFGDSVGLAPEELDFFLTKPKGVIEKVRYSDEDGFTFTVLFGKYEARVGLKDIKLI